MHDATGRAMQMNRAGSMQPMNQKELYEIGR